MQQATSAVTHAVERAPKYLPLQWYTRKSIHGLVVRSSILSVSLWKLPRADSNSVVQSNWRLALPQLHSNDGNLEEDRVPFEQVAMECCLKHVCHVLEEGVRDVEPRLRKVRH